ncbi:hypothetical protein BOX15_Mlig016274g5 [Macrostomum lignano]|uniref:Uncharacterized protein n=2 Tax=Macrostomum lignano TaxID=282301 RepID=A0A267DRA3_9PLAT|nr:hypothetical protein BOX15_Mlig016274g5 [Macrostomum lignano]
MAYSRAVLALTLLLAAVPLALTAPGPAARPNNNNNERLLSRVRRIIGNADEVNEEEKQRLFPFSVTITGSYYVRVPKKIGFITLNVPVKRQVHCGASILDRNHVITAAHCLLDEDGDLIASTSWKVYMHSIKRKPSMYERMKSWFARKASKLTGKNIAENVAHHAHFKKIHIHPSYDKGSILHDVAVIETSDIRYDQISHAGPIGLPPSEVVRADGPTPGTLCDYSGWGCTRPKGSVREKLLMAQFTVKPLGDCTSVFQGGDSAFWQKNLCVQANRTTVCPGDSGGGLRCEHNGQPYLAGIASSAATGANPELYPANFMRITGYISWIRETMALSSAS